MAIALNSSKGYSSTRVECGERSRTKMYYFYILRCSDNSLYCGQTNDLKRRIKEHKLDKAKSAKYLRAKRPVKLIYSEEYPTLQLAMKREWQIKKWSKAKKEALIQGNKILLKKL